LVEVYGNIHNQVCKMRLNRIASQVHSYNIIDRKHPNDLRTAFGSASNAL
jgi:hypothetical protein